MKHRRIALLVDPDLFGEVAPLRRLSSPAREIQQVARGPAPRLEPAQLRPTRPDPAALLAERQSRVAPLLMEPMLLVEDRVRISREKNAVAESSESPGQPFVPEE